MLRVVHYVNQFFGGIGGEEKADVAEKNLRVFDPSIPNNQRSAILKDRQKEIKSLRQQAQLIKEGNAPDEFARELKDEIAKWIKVAKAAGIKLE